MSVYLSVCLLSVCLNRGPHSLAWGLWMGIPFSPLGHSQSRVTQCVAGAMYITGFAESIAGVLSLSNIWAVRGISLAVLLGLLGINLAGVKWIIRLQLLLLFLLAVSTLDFVIGSFTHLDPGKTGGSLH